MRAVHDNEAYRTEIGRRLELVRADVAHYFDAAHPSLAAVREAIDRALDDVGSVLGMEAKNEFWVTCAAQQLASAEAQFINVKSLIERFGGPTREQSGGS
jgi:hypothetical protein